MTTTPDPGLTLALQALTWIAGDDQALGGFLAVSGAGPADLRNRMTDPEFLGGVLDYLLGMEESLLAFCDHAHLQPTDVVRARRALPGGEGVGESLRGFNA